MSVLSRRKTLPVSSAPNKVYYCMLPFSCFLGLSSRRHVFLISSVVVHSLLIIMIIITDFHTLTNLMKQISHEVVSGGGLVRGIHNHGIRDLPQRFKARYADKQGMRYYTKGRFISVYYDSNPATMRQVEQILAMDEDVLRNTHLRARSLMDFVNIGREERNPFIKQVLKDEKKQQEDAKVLNDTVERVIEDMRTDDA